MTALATLSQRKKRARQVLEELERHNPDPRCELTYHTPFHLLVSVVLSAQTTDKMVNRVMEPLYEESFTPQTVLDLGVDRFLLQIKQIGLAPTKAKNVVRLSEQLLKLHGGEVPDTREALEALPGVGRKTANVILGEIFRHPTLAVDTHVFRVSDRLGLQHESTPEKAELELLKVVDPALLPAGHHHFILHGRYTCKAINPACSTCVVSSLCPSRDVDFKAERAAERKKPVAKTSATRPKKALKKKKVSTGRWRA